jgi:transposase InsO family protein
MLRSISFSPWLPLTCSHGLPGQIRIDTVHQGDQNGHKGVYHINAVDEVTQWEVVVSLERITEKHLESNLEGLLRQFPFQVTGFHSDNGSEFVNKIVADILNKLLIRFTRSRPRHPDDNGLVESKNARTPRPISSI